MKYDITPVPKPRQTQRDKWKKRPSVLRYRAFADEVRLKLVARYRPLFTADEKLDLCKSEITFWMPMPKSWSKKKKEEMNGRPHTQRPDIDNLIKALADAIHTDDSHLYRIRAVKLWSRKGAITVTRMEP